VFIESFDARSENIMSLKNSLTEAMKEAMRAKDKPRLGAIRLVLAEVKRVEVDERITVSDERLVSILDKMVKQRRDSISQYQTAGRSELAEVESYEISVIQEFLPTALTNDEINQLIASAIAQSGAESMRDMGKVMGILKPQIQGRADGGVVSGLVKSALNS